MVFTQKSEERKESGARQMQALPESVICNSFTGDYQGSLPAMSAEITGSNLFVNFTH